MRRDMDLVRQILIIAADEPGYIDSGRLKDRIADNSYSQNQINYHATIMREAGLIDASESVDYIGDTAVTVKGLTWAGQDYLAAVSNDHVWTETKKKIAKAAQSATLAIIKMTAEAITEAMIKSML